MKYLEDYISEELIDCLEIELKNIYDNDEFTIGIMSMLENDSEAKELLDYLKNNNFTEETSYKVALFQLDLKSKREKSI